MDMPREQVLNTVADNVIPSDDEVSAMQDAVDKLRNRVSSELEARNINADIVQTGSTARSTWVSGDRDIDLFVRFPTGMSEDAIETNITEIGNSVLPDAHKDFASHVYVKGTLDGFDVDIVPCFDVETAEDIQSAVDRTPFHTEFLREALTPELQRDVRLAKKFLKGINAYGSDVATGGFSGFLTELLILDAGGFIPLLEEVRTWTPPIRIDMHGNGEPSDNFEGPLIVIDPTDSGRNVAAALSDEKFALFQHQARQFLDNPDTDFFTERDVDNVTAVDMNEVLSRRGTTFTLVVFEKPTDAHKDTIIPQMQKSISSIQQQIEDAGFEPISTHIINGDDRISGLFETAHSTVPPFREAQGPPVHMEEHAQDFVAEHDDNPDVIGPFIQGDRLVIRKPRPHTDIESLLASPQLNEQVSLGPLIEENFDARRVVPNNDIAGDLSPEERQQVVEALNPSI